MKKLLFAVVSLAILSMTGCKDDTGGVSRVTFFPDFNLIGGQYYIIVAGDGEFVEPGVEVTENGTPIDYTVTGVEDIDTETPGIYPIEYTAVNQDGYPKSATRYVVVLPETPDPSVDLSGTYSLTSPTGFPDQVLTVSKLADGVFYCDNLLGPTFNVKVPCIIFCTDGANILIPEYDAFGDGVIVYVGDTGTVLSSTSFKYTAFFVFGGSLYSRARTWTKI